MNRLILRRSTYSRDCTHGTLQVVDAKGAQLVRVFTLELPWKNNKPQVSCIPAGKYRIKREYSPAFKRHLWELKDVPNRSEVKIHAANYVKELKGCIAPCLRLGDLDGDRIVDALNSAKALQSIHDALVGIEETTIEVI